jgi:Putative heavy-metal-binding
MSTVDLPPEAAGRLEQATFSSGLSVPDFAACLHMGMRPVGLVQGYCVMRWSWYGAGSPYSTTAYWTGRGQGSTLSSYRCPHGYFYGSGEHRSWGANVEQPWVVSSWMQGYRSAFTRMREEAAEAGAHGVIGVIDRSSHLIDGGIREFHIYGTAVVIEGADPPEQIWTSYLAGQRLAKLIEAGFFPVSVVASMASVRVWAVCSTEILLRGGYDQWGTVRPTDEIVQVADAEMQARRLARNQLRADLGSDSLHGARLEVGWHEISEGDFERNCTLRGTRVRRFKDADPLPIPVPTVTLG